MTKGLLYYTNNECAKSIMDAVCERIGRYRNGVPLVSVSHVPMEFGRNVVVPLKSSILSLFKQMLIGLIILETDYVFCLEHDVLYHQSHFDFVPPRTDMFYFNKNVWSVNAETGECLHYDGMKKTSCLVADRELLLSHCLRKVRTIERDGWSNRLGFEPGKRLGNFEFFESEHPNIDIKWGGNVVRWRGKLEQYRCRERIRDSWQLTDSIPGWGVSIKGRFNEFLWRSKYV